MKSSEFIKLIKEDATGGSTSSPSVAISMENLGVTPSEMIKRQKTYTNQLTKGGPVRVKKVK
jgi:hypothetical protein